MRTRILVSIWAHVNPSLNMTQVGPLQTLLCFIFLLRGGWEEARVHFATKHSK
jgi:hypothetical protein